MTLLIIAHTPSDNTRALAEALLEGAAHERECTARVCSPWEVEAEDLVSARGIILLTPENFGYMSGALKDMFDRCYTRCLEKTQGKPYMLCIRAGKEGTGAQRSVSSIVNGLGWRAVQQVLVFRGDFSPDFIDQARQAGSAMAAGLAMGIF